MTSRLVSLVQFQNSGILNIYKMVIFVQKRHGCGKKNIGSSVPILFGQWEVVVAGLSEIATKNGDSASN